jgi:hypothetical protein
MLCDHCKSWLFATASDYARSAALSAYRAAATIQTRALLRRALASPLRYFWSSRSWSARSPRVSASHSWGKAWRSRASTAWFAAIAGQFSSPAPGLLAQP